MSKKKFGEDHEISGVRFKYEKKTKYLTIEIGDQKRRLKKTDLWMLVFMMSKDKQQDDLIPVWEKDMVQFTRFHTIKATKDIKEGEIIKFHCDVNVPKIVVDSLLVKEGVTDPASVMKEADKEVIHTPEGPQALHEKTEGV